MNLEEKCKEGRIEIDKFFEFIESKMAVRTHALDIGDYVVLAFPYQEDHVDVERIAELDSPEKGDFVTVQGTTGPISGNVFIKINKGKGRKFPEHPEYLFIIGDRVTADTGSVYELLNKYLARRCNSN